MRKQGLDACACVSCRSCSEAQQRREEPMCVVGSLDKAWARLRNINVA